MSDSPEERKSSPDARAEETTAGVSSAHESSDAAGEAKDAKPGSSPSGTSGSEATKALLASDDSSNGRETASDSGSKSDRGLMLWVVGILVVLSVELFIYGHNGDVKVCVGVEGATDFSLVGQNRTPENFRKFPQCAQRLNLGMWTSSAEQAQGALEEACGRATLRSGAEEKLACIRKDKNWKRVVTKDHVPPWDRRLYRRLLWLD